MVNGPPFYDETEWEPDEPVVKKTVMQWLHYWSSDGNHVSTDFTPAPPGGELHGHVIMVDGVTYRNARGTWEMTE